MPFPVVKIIQPTDEAPHQKNSVDHHEDKKRIALIYRAGQEPTNKNGWRRSKERVNLKALRTRG
jgi:hypothetical protein